jgi:hypothetical protein
LQLADLALCSNRRPFLLERQSHKANQISHKKRAARLQHGRPRRGCVS